MKNLMIFVDPRNNFTEEHKVLAKIQVDNSLELGWDTSDIMVVTNFPWEYRGVWSVIVPDDLYYPSWPLATKLPVINHMFRDGMITDQYWFHDFDAFQLETMGNVKSDFAATFFNSKDRRDFRWAGGSFFFHDAMEAFCEIENRMFAEEIDEETALARLYRENKIIPEVLDARWNINIYDIEYNMSIAVKPIMAAHFHPRKSRHMNLFRNIIPERLKVIFRRHGYSNA